MSGDPAFARDFFARYVDGHEVPDYARLLMNAGLVLRKRFPGRASWGLVSVEVRDGVVQVAAPTPSNSPAYAAGLDMGNTVREIDGARVRSVEDVTAAIGRHKPGDTMRVLYTDRTSVPRTASVALIEDPRLELVPIETAEGTLTAAQKSFRDRWLGPTN